MAELPHSFSATIEKNFFHYILKISVDKTDVVIRLENTTTSQVYTGRKTCASNPDAHAIGFSYGFSLTGFTTDYKPVISSSFSSKIDDLEADTPHFIVSLSGKPIETITLSVDPKDEIIDAKAREHIRKIAKAKHTPRSSATATSSSTISAMSFAPKLKKVLNVIHFKHCYFCAPLNESTLICVGKLEDSSFCCKILSSDKLVEIRQFPIESVGYNGCVLDTTKTHMFIAHTFYSSKQIYCYKISDGEKVSMLSAPENILSLSYNLQKSLIVCSLYKGKIALVEFKNESLSLVKTFSHFIPDHVYSSVIGVEGLSVFVGDKFGNFAGYSIAEGSLLFKKSVGKELIRQIVPVSKTSFYLATSTDLFLYDRIKDTCTLICSFPNAIYSLLLLSSNILAIGTIGVVHIVDVGRGTVLSKIVVDQIVSSISQTGSVLFSSTNSGSIARIAA